MGAVQAKRRRSLSDGIVPLATFKQHIAGHLRELRESGEPLIVTKHGAPVAVLVTLEEYETMRLAREALR